MKAALIINMLTLVLVGVMFHYHRLHIRAMQRRIDIRNAHHRDFHADCQHQHWSGDPQSCPRCGSSNLRGHASNEPMGLTCNVCGWIRYIDPDTHTLWNALTQPPWTTAA